MARQETFDMYGIRPEPPKHAADPHLAGLPGPPPPQGLPLRGRSGEHYKTLGRESLTGP